MLRITIKAELVREHLARRQISQNNLAMKVGISSGYLSQLLMGYRCPGPRVRKRLMKALGIKDFDELFTMMARPPNERGQAYTGRTSGVQATAHEQ